MSDITLVLDRKKLVATTETNLIDRACQQGTGQNYRRGTPRLFPLPQKRLQMGTEYYENMLLRHPIFL